MKKIYNVLEIEGYSDFKCIGPECEDDCCKGWKILVDKKAYLMYSQIKDKSIKNRVLNSINIKTKMKNTSNAGVLKLGKDSRCKLQEDDRLCFLHKNLGEDSLCRTCKVYPKVINEVDGVLELSHTLSCPEAVRKILMVDKPKEFNCAEKEIDGEFIATSIECDKSYNLRKQLFWEIRSATIHILQSRKYKLWQRVILAGFMFESLEEVFKLGDKNEVIKSINKYKDIVNNEEIIKINIPIEEDKQLEIINSIYYFISDCMAVGDVNIDRLYIKEIDIRKADLDSLKEVIQEYEYVFENYIVNYIFQNLIPLNVGTFTEQYYRMIFNYGFIISLLYGKTSVGEITEETIINVIYLMTRSIMHSPEKIQEIEKEFKRNNMYSLAYITLAVKF
ncbi:MAG: flagellin lysine-N-methylase [Clostridium sp.]